MTRSRLSLVLCAAAACYSPRPPEGAPCAPGAACPAPLVCDPISSTCVGSIGAHDAAPLDAGIDTPVGSDAAIVDAPGSGSAVCACSSGGLTCGGVTEPCSLGCLAQPAPHCAAVQASNGVDLAGETAGTTSLTFTGPATLDTDTGAITGSVTRAAGAGLIGGIQFTPTLSGSAPVGIFGMTGLSISAGVTVQVVGTRAAIFAVAGDVHVTGKLDLSARCAGPGVGCGGPGGGLGATSTTAATGCAGGRGALANGSLGGGGGGGGGGQLGGAGGAVGGMGAGTPGIACMAATLEPLVGGGGGGFGHGSAGALGNGGGGGGAVQISASGTIVVAGLILAAGGGGTGGTNDMSAINLSAGNGGGAGGGILLEAPSVSVAGTLAANGGGGGATGGFAAGSGTASPGADGTSTSTPAPGGAAGVTGVGGGGAGGAAAIGAQPGHPGQAAAQASGGGGGGGVGGVMVRGTSTLTGTVTPAPNTGALRTQ